MDQVGIVWICVTIFILSLSKFFTRLRSVLNYCFYMVFCNIVALLPLFLFPFRPFDSRNALSAAFVGRFVARLVGLAYKIEGLENVNISRGGIIVINHQNVLDMLVLAYIWPHIGPASVVVKKELMYYAIFGVASWTWGSLFIDRSNPQRAIESLERQADAIESRKMKLIFFPEGTRNKGERLLTFKKGPFRLALQCRCPVQPIVVSRNDFFRSVGGTSGRGVIRILPEVDTTDIDIDCLAAFIERVHGEMDDVYRELNRKIAC
ncbi:1-acyl-sn-glycerol-3-phosphate acyltransferase alpha-like [Phlebotomus argentipes]|uniref:1-acyl-sn-glycerol-3-phosphate acyltransferase alpha-like n=1 Tax=Phlebotomus argentipes TaxID=94469 RepID=UPI002892ECA1|nr:1-acyl-sn-glycerol-3-phosphate acyltransferase alpha-like [Phlebotomus argentipes]